MSAPLPPDEEQRLEELKRYEVLDTLPEAAFDDLVRLAAEICETPMALMSLVDASRQWFKAAVGLEVKETQRSVAFCAHAILERELFTVPDAMSDARFAHNPLVTGSPHLRFYAGAPIQTSAGSAIGTVCVLDRVPRQLTPFQENALRVIGNQVQAQLALRRHIQELAHSHDQLRKERDQVLRLREEADELRSFVLHDLKNALATIGPNAEFLLASDLLAKDEDETAAARDIHSSAERMKRMVRELLDSRSLNAGSLVVRIGDVDLRMLVHDTARVLRRRIEAKGQRVAVRVPEEGVVVRGDEALLERVIENLLDNALKYGASPDGTLAIELRVETDPPRAILTVSDEGPGIPDSARERVFERNARLDRDAAKDAHSSYGIGLAFCRAAVVAHSGRIWAEANSPSGAKFVIELPGDALRRESR